MNPRRLSTVPTPLRRVAISRFRDRDCRPARDLRARRTPDTPARRHARTSALPLTPPHRSSPPQPARCPMTIPVKPICETHVAMAEPSLAGAVADASITLNLPEPVVETAIDAIRRIAPPNSEPAPCASRKRESVGFRTWRRRQGREVHRDCRRVLGRGHLHRSLSVGALSTDAQGRHHQGCVEWRNVTVKRKGKRVTVSKAFTKLVDQDFGWKDPKAAERAGMSMMDYVIGGMDRSFKLKLFHMLHAAEAAGLSPGITSAFRDDYRQSIASGLKAASNRSYHGGSLRGGYGHGLAADVVSVQGGTRNQRWASSEKLWKWVDAHGKEFGIGRPYLGRDPPHVAPVDGQEYAKHNRGTKQAGSNAKKVNIKQADRTGRTRAPNRRDRTRRR